MAGKLEKLDLIDGKFCLDGSPVDVNVLGLKVILQPQLYGRRPEGSDAYYMERRFTAEGPGDSERKPYHPVLYLSINREGF